MTIPPPEQGSIRIYLYGLMLTLLDNRIEGPVRERMLISYYRYKGSSENLTKVSNLCRSSGYLPSSAKRPANYPEDLFARVAPPQHVVLMRAVLPVPLSTKRPANYPEDLFARVAPPQHVVLMVVNRLRSDDIYNQMAQWPSPDHRCTALASQAAILYIVLFFVPSVLHKESAMMREIVDKHFSDNWVISFYMGLLSARVTGHADAEANCPRFVVDLSVMWEPYKAAHTALKNTLDPAQVVRPDLERF
ncbi:WASH complex, subunit strumpellin [Baffinella frigidus]|nr:WASH complex, subunit strumpellin [Cryptophyta sp. CCMP2293]